MACLVNGSEIVLTGVVGDAVWDDGFYAFEVIQALATIGHDQDVTVRLNSGGGYATEGTAVHAALTAHGGRVRMIVEGIAASAASVIAMAGDTVTMALGAVLMIHDAAVITLGDVTEHERSLRALNTISDGYAAIYAARTGRPAAEMRDLMRAETWLTAEQALQAGFVDAIGAANDNGAEPSAYDYRVYARAPERLVAMARQHGWRMPTANLSQQQETPVTGQAQTDTGTAPAATHQTAPAATLDPAKIAAEAVAADRKRRADVLALAETKGREALAEHLLASTDMEPTAIKATLAAAPKAGDAQPTDDANPTPEAYATERAAAGAGLAMPGGRSAAHPRIDHQAIYNRMNGVKG